MISIRTILFILVRLTNSYVKAIKISNNYSIVKEVNFQIVSGEIGTKLIFKKNVYYRDNARMKGKFATGVSGR